MKLNNLITNQFHAGFRQVIAKGLCSEEKMMTSNHDTTNKWSETRSQNCKSLPSFVKNINTVYNRNTALYCFLQYLAQVIGEKTHCPISFRMCFW